MLCQLLVCNHIRKRRTVCNFFVRQSRLNDSACIGGRSLCVLSVLICSRYGTSRARKDDFLHEPPARVVVDALNDLRGAHAHLVLPCGIRRIEEEFAVFDSDSTNAACDHLAHDIRPVGECCMRDVAALECRAEAVDGGAHIIACARCAEYCAHCRPSLSTIPI